jgi:uncharacterized ferritin-like protein (DUF455 family)
MLAEELYIVKINLFVIIRTLIGSKGLDAGPKLVQMLFGSGDHRSADIVASVREEELAHVPLGLYWFFKVCQMMCSDICL